MAHDKKHPHEAQQPHDDAAKPAETGDMPMSGQPTEGMETMTDIEPDAVLPDPVDKKPYQNQLDGGETAAPATTGDAPAPEQQALFDGLPADKRKRRAEIGMRIAKIDQDIVGLYDLIEVKKADKAALRAVLVTKRETPPVPPVPPAA